MYPPSLTAMLLEPMCPRPVLTYSLCYIYTARVKVVEEFNFYRNEWKNRRNKCVDVIDNMSEGMDKKVKNHTCHYWTHTAACKHILFSSCPLLQVKDVMELMGIESDEAEKVKLPEPIAVAKK